MPHPGEPADRQARLVGVGFPGMDIEHAGMSLRGLLEKGAANHREGELAEVTATRGGNPKTEQ